MSDCLWPMDCSPPGSSVHEDSPGKNTGVGYHALLQGIFPKQGSNPDLPHCRQILYHLSPWEALWATRKAHHVSFCQLGLLLSLASTFLGLSQSYFSQVRSKSQHVSAECVISLVLSCCNKNLKWQTSVTAWLQLRVLFSKQRIIHPRGMRVSHSKGKP